MASSRPVHAPEPRPIEGRKGLVNSFASGGANYSVVVEAFG